ncbi:hypothetical protein GH733_018081 [Mirounga leonina]|nr:hypothetical protein GH733_018081 [Mirounga leonina]
MEVQASPNQNTSCGGLWPFCTWSRCTYLGFSAIALLVEISKSTDLRSLQCDRMGSVEELKAPLEEYVHKRYPGLVKVVRNQKREGLIRARIEGWKVATGQVTGFFDAHVEFTAGWAEPVLSRIQENRKRVILPSIDNIKQDTFEVQRYENSAHGYSWELWCMYISPPKDWWDAGDPSLPISFQVQLTKQ